MSYPTGWRLALAADPLREPGVTGEAVARRGATATAFALSTAFERVRGITAARHRLETTAGAPG